MAVKNSDKIGKPMCRDQTKAIKCAFLL